MTKQDILNTLSQIGEDASQAIYYMLRDEDGEPDSPPFGAGGVEADYMQAIYHIASCAMEAQHVARQLDELFQPSEESND